MGFMDKAKKMAEQAQAKLDEAQKQFNASQPGHRAGGPAVEYDKHGRPVQPAPVVARRRRARSAGASGRDPGGSADRDARAARARIGPDAGPGRPGSARHRSHGAARDARPGSDRGPQPPQQRAAEALQRGSAGGLTLRSCASCAPTKAC